MLGVRGAHLACGLGIQRHAVFILLPTISQEAFKVTMSWCGSQSPCPFHIAEHVKTNKSSIIADVIWHLDDILLPARSANRNLRISRTSWKSRQAEGWCKKVLKMFEEPLALPELL